MAWETGWDTMGNNLISFYFGSSSLFYIALLLLFVLFLIVIGLDIRYVAIFILPLVAVFSAFGAFGATGWIYSVTLLAISFVYAYAIMKLFT